MKSEQWGDIVTRNPERLAQYFHEYHRRRFPYLSREWFYDTTLDAMMLCAREGITERSHYLAYAGMVVFRAASKTVRSQQVERRYREAMGSRPEDHVHIDQCPEDRELPDNLMQLVPNSRCRQVVEEIFVNGRTLRDVARTLKISHEGVRKILKPFYRKVKLQYAIS